MCHLELLVGGACGWHHHIRHLLGAPFSIKAVTTWLWVILLPLWLYGEHQYHSGQVSPTVKLSPGPTRHLSVFNKLPVHFSYLLRMTVPVYSARTALPRTGLPESASLSLVHLHTELLCHNIREYRRARPTTYQWGRFSPPYLEVVFCQQLVAAISFLRVTPYQELCTGIVRLVSAHQ